MKLLDKMHKFKTMLPYCLKCRKNRENINLKISGTSNGKAMILSKFAIFGTKKSKFIKKQKANGLFSSLGYKKPLMKIPLFGPLLF